MFGLKVLKVREGGKVAYPKRGPLLRSVVRQALSGRTTGVKENEVSLCSVGNNLGTGLSVNGEKVGGTELSSSLHPLHFQFACSVCQFDELVRFLAPLRTLVWRREDTYSSCGRIGPIIFDMIPSPAPERPV